MAKLTEAEARAHLALFWTTSQQVRQAIGKHLVNKTRPTKNELFNYATMLDMAERPLRDKVKELNSDENT